MYRYDVDESARLVTATFEGQVSDNDLFDYLSHMLSHTRYGTGWRTLIDMTPAAAMNLTQAGVQRMRALPLHMEERLGGAKVAILVLAKSPGFDMATMYKKLGEWARYKIEVFVDRDDAIAWLLSDK